MTTTTTTTTYVAAIDLEGSEMERPFMLGYVEAATPEEATAKAQQGLEVGEVVRDVRPLQPILEDIIARREAGTRFSLSFKHESGTSGPVWVTDLDAADAAHDGKPVLGIPFGSDPDWMTGFPWMRRSEAKRLAKYLDIPYEES